MDCRPRLGYLPALDGLRAVAVVSVVAVHAAPGFSAGGLGVDVFFVLSGFLITALIAGEISEGTFSRRRFYARRAIRLMPALVVTVVVFTPIAMVVFPHGNTPLGAAAALFYFTPFVAPTVFLHTATLAYEEWYYLAWPLALGKMVRDQLTLRQCALLVGVLGLVGQVVMVLAPGGGRWSGLLIGSALGLWWLDGGKFPRPGLSVVLGLGLIVSGVVAGPAMWGALPFWAAVAGTVLVIGGLMSGARGRVVTVLESRIPVAIGVISYEWYLIHFPLIMLTQFQWGLAASLWTVPLSLVMAFALHHALAPLQARMRRRQIAVPTASRQVA
jgi:peptidoglycan/LPS O-acetylase OafA/YrhL